VTVTPLAACRSQGVRRADPLLCVGEVKEELPQRRMLHAPMAEEAAYTKESSAERSTTSTSPSTTPPETRFRVMTYNLLAPSWTSPNGTRRHDHHACAGPVCIVVHERSLSENLSHTNVDHGCPEWAHKWSYRKRKILWEVLHSRADIVCFQEIEKRAYEGYPTSTVLLLLFRFANAFLPIKLCH
jgi:hypothetical protein